MRNDQPTDDPMPVFVIKAKDKLALRTLEAYTTLCVQLGLDEQAREVDKAYEEMRQWQERNRDRIKFPDHPHVPATTDTRPQGDPPVWPQDRATDIGIVATAPYAGGAS